MRFREIFILSLPLLLCGCMVNSYGHFYQSNLTDQEVHNLMPYSGETKVFYANDERDYKENISDLQANGYVMLGESNFQEGGVWNDACSTDTQLKLYSHRIGADVALCLKQQGETYVSQRAYTTYEPGTMTITPGPAMTTVTSTPGTARTVISPDYMETFNFQTSFWRKNK